MTTNYLEKIDSALIRSGRVDLQIKFMLATREQIQEIFRRMYSTERDVKKRIKPQISDSNTLAAAQRATHNLCTTCTYRHAHGTSASIAVELPPEKLAEMADQFAAQLPDTTFSSAEIQGFLLMKKKDPIGALAGSKSGVRRCWRRRRRAKR
jgi:chaperone BCS1